MEVGRIDPDTTHLVLDAVEDGVIDRAEKPLALAIIRDHGADTFTVFCQCRKRAWVEREIRVQIGLTLR